MGLRKKNVLVPVKKYNYGFGESVLNEADLYQRRYV